MTYQTLRAGTALFLFAAASSASAQDLTIGLASEPTSVDPHYHDLSPNNALNAHIYSGLAAVDAEQAIQPALATSWEAVDETTWVFNLREDVVFSDGSAFDADDVIYTFCRTMNNETSIGSVGTSTVANFASVEAVDPHTVRITTTAVEPLMPELLAQVMILSDGISEHGEISFDLENNCGVTGAWPSIDDFNTGSAAIGTGPFVLEEFTLGSGIKLSRNDQYYGDAPDWESVEFVPVPSDGPRLAGILSGDYDLIENPAARDIPQIESRDGLEYVSTPSIRVIFLQLDVGREDSPHVSAPDGLNPLMDRRVRQAMSMAIDRQAIVDRIMNGFATPAYQLAPDNLFGAIADPEPLEFNPERAQELLAEAGYPDGFEITLHATNDRYINDSQVAQAVAQFLTRVGIDTELDAMTRSIFFTERRNNEFSFSMGGWGSSEGGAASFLRQFATTANPDLGVGGSNYGGWSYPEYDALLLEAISTVDTDRREAMLQEAEQMAVDEMAFIPLHVEHSIWAFRDGLNYGGRADQYTLAYEVTRAGE